jgi:hypothetical protein
MNKKWLLHIITFIAFLIFIVLYSACASITEGSSTTFPSGFLGTWKKDDFGNTLTFTKTILQSSSQNYNCGFQSASGDFYVIKEIKSDTDSTINIKIENGNLEIDGDNGIDEDNWNGVWLKQSGTTHNILAQSKSSSEPSPQYWTGNGGKGLVIAVPAPSISGASQSDNWMPQLFQDLITGDMAKFSAMTVLDRRNESMILAEQQLSASGNYSDNDYIAMGRLTNAKYIVAGNILGVSSRYSVTFRINNTETNEIQASFNKQYLKADIESGLAAKEAVVELLTGMGVSLTATGESQLLAIQENSVRAQVRLAQGMTAEKNNNVVESLVYFQEALNADQGMSEASQRIQNFAQGSPGASIRERANWATAQKEKWEKIFNDLYSYANENLLIIVYDLSSFSDQFNARTNTVDITVTPGVKLIPNSTVLTVWKRIVDQWEQIKYLEENKSWTNSVSVKKMTRDMDDIRQRLGYDDEYYCSVSIGLYDDEGIRIAQTKGGGKFDIRYNKNLQILPQNRYFSNRPFNKVTFTMVKINDITDELHTKVDNNMTIARYGNESNIPSRIMSLSEYDEWVKKQ